MKICYKLVHFTYFVHDAKNNDNKEMSATNSSTSKNERSLLKTITIMIVAATVVIVASMLIDHIERHYEGRYGQFLKVGVVAIVGYFAINSLANVFYKLAFDSLKNNAKVIRILIRILGTIIMISIIISYLSHDPIIAASIGTITTLVIGFASQNVLGNLIAGLYLAIVRPFRIGEKVTVFGNTGVIYDIGLLYSTLRTDEGDVIIAPNTAMITTTIVIRKL